MPESRQLNTWIAESGSWQSFIDFQLPKDAMADYNFYSRIDDFYLSLMSRAIELWKKKESLENTEELLAVAKGLEIFSLRKKRMYFGGVNYSNNILYAASLYYLSNYPSSAWILANIYKSDNYKNEIDMFISNFLKRKFSKNSFYEKILNVYLKTGDLQLLNSLKNRIEEQKEAAFNENIDDYFSFSLAEKIVEKFQKDNIWKDLLKENNNPFHWKSYVNQSINKTVPVWSFFPSQKMAIEKGILDRETYSLQMPTSAGKTSISELIIYDEFRKNNNCKILYLAPYRALASELKQTLAVYLGRLGIKSKTIYGGNVPTLEERTSISKINLLISTPEKFMAFEDIISNISNEFTTIICDEGHLLDDETRGLSYELLLSRLKGNQETNKRFIFISAIIPNISTVNSWLGGSANSLITSNYRPTELEYAFLKRMNGKKIGYYLDVNPFKQKPYNYQLYKYLWDKDLKSHNPKDGKLRSIKTKRGISVAVSLKAIKSGTVALFAPHKRGDSGVEGLAEETINQLINKIDINLTKYSTSDYLSSLKEYFEIVFGSNYLLTKCSTFGVLYHHGDFPQNIREIIEDSLRQGFIRFVICTNTLSEGVNLPIKTIVIHSTKRYNPDIKNWEKIKIRDLKNLVGRAGRAGKETKGLVIVPDKNDFDVITRLIKETNIEPVKGQLYNIIKIITDYLQRRQLKISSKILDSLNEQFQELLDSIDISMVDLLSEEIEIGELNQLVKDLITQTFSFYQANEKEKQTLNKLFEIRADKLEPIIKKGDFSVLKNSGSNIRLFEDINSHFDFENEIWNETFNTLNQNWLNYILDNGIFKLEMYAANLKLFNNKNKCDLNNKDIKKAIILWMSGSWFEGLSRSLKIEIFQAMRLINFFLGFNVQNMISTIIRIKELKYLNYSASNVIANWPSLLQYGLNTQIHLDLVEMGLIDRISVLVLSNHLDSDFYIHSDYETLKKYLINNGSKLLVEIQNNLPVISFEKTSSFLDLLKIRNIY